MERKGVRIVNGRRRDVTLPGGAGPAACSAAFEAGQVAVGRDVGESGRGQQLTYGLALAVAVLDDQPATRHEVRRRRWSMTRSASRPSVPANSAPCGSKRRTAGSTRRIVLRNVRRIAGDEVEALVRDRLEPVARRGTRRWRGRAAPRCAGQRRRRRRRCRCRPHGARAVPAQWPAQWRRCRRRGPAPAPARRAASASSASSTTSSVSGRGMSTSGVTSSGSDQNSFSPRM